MNRLVLALVLAGCGNDRAPLVDSPDAAIDAALPVGCDFVELADATNDHTVSNGAAEVTGLVVTEAATVCARVDRNHFDSVATTVDIDSFELRLAARSTVVVSFVAPANAAAIAALTSLDVEVLDTTNAFVDGGRFLGSHAVFASTLAAGTYRLAITAKSTADIAAAVDYKLRLAVDAPDVRCAKSAATAAYTEADDGAQHNRNDVVEVRYLPSERALTAAAVDAPEPTALTTAAGTAVRITGDSADVDAADDFKDRDTYLMTTGAHDQLTIRIDWTGDADFDFFVFPEDSVAEIARGTTVGKTAPERATFPVLANTRYWLWVGSYDTTTGLPITYDATLCPATFE